MRGLTVTRLKPTYVDPPNPLPSHFQTTHTHRSSLQDSALSSTDSTIYTEPFFRAMVLGVSCGALLETAHTLLSAPLAANFSPLFWPDHIAAAVAWAFFYALDVVAIKAVLDAHRGDERGAAPALQRLVTLPKRFLPVRLAVFKHALALLKGPTAVSVETIETVSEQEATDTAAGTATTTAAAAITVETNILPKTPRTARVAVPVGAPARPGGLLPGQMDPGAVEALRHRRRELADRRAYLYGFWYAAAQSDAVKPGKPLGVDILDQRLVLFREEGSGVVRALDDACPHRGASLSAGWLSSAHGPHTCVVCPYHAWAIDGNGRVKDVPAAETAGEWPSGPLVPAYDVQERGGFVWLWYGPKETPAESRPPIPFCPELEDPEWKSVTGEIEFEQNHSSVFENALDFAHIHYVHSSSFGNEDQPVIRDMTCEVEPHGVTATFRLHNKPASPIWEWSRVPEVHVTAQAFLPSTSRITFTLGHGLSFTTFVSTVPVSPTKSVNRFALVRNLAWDKMGAFNADVWDRWARAAMMKILGEDKVVVERLRPEALLREYSVRADLPQVQFRKLRQQWVNRGFVRYPESGSGSGPGGGCGSCGSKDPCVPPSEVPDL